MKKIRMRALAVLMVLVLTASALAGCSGGGTDETTQGAAAGTEQASQTEEQSETEAGDTAQTEGAGESQGASGVTGDKTVQVPGGFEPVDITTNEPYKIVVTQMNTSDANAATAMDSFREAGQYYGVEVIVMDNKGDAVQANTNLENAITMEADFFFEYNADEGANERIAQRLREVGMPAIAIQVELGDDFPYFRLDPAMSGEASGTPLAEAAQEKFGDDVDFLVVLGYPEAGPVIADRSAAAIEAVKKIYPDIEVIEYSSKADTETSRSGMQDILTAHPEGNFLFWGHHDQYTLAAYRAVRASGREDQCLVTSIVALESMCEEIQREGTSVIGTVSIRPEIWGWMMLPYAIDYLNNGTEIPHDLYQPCQLITKENMAEIYPERVISN